ncbi:fatty acyl-AMP ligase [Pseudomonas sp. WJP1]|uniref:fatty acyl-AMP ligase n=1 Tax=Pseudomonas sp. WJP1 TaxID=2986947 RepID=UPI00234B0DE8|nr:fatty acyl-AMP ligase [Pseudomonas sp. WJP1]WCM54040.1 fatty acyl-AMP ligase [Pseudomonas sp. WJP1]
MSATLSNQALTQRLADFSTLVEALDYAASGHTGLNFYDRHCHLDAALEYATLRSNAVAIAQRLLGLKLKKGDRVALIADTHPSFIESFFACQYAGLIAVPLLVPSSLGSHRPYVDKLKGLFANCTPAAVLGLEEWLPYIREALGDTRQVFVGSVQKLGELPAVQALPSVLPEDIAYLQYTSGSTRFPRGVIITQRAVMANIRGIVVDGVGVRAGDRCASWLPFYHDMGLVGFVLAPMAAQLTVDYLHTRDFATRPGQWLKLISQNRVTVSVSPPFGYDLCTRRVRDLEKAALDLRCWRVAGIGAEPIRASVLSRFANCFLDTGFDPAAFTPCYGLAESTLAVSFARRGVGVQVDHVVRQVLEHQFRAQVCTADDSATCTFTNCGAPLPGHCVEIRNAAGLVLAEREVGHIFVQGPSVMSGYFNDSPSTQMALKADWLDTGDLGYLSRGELHITGRRKDLLIVRGRNIWPQDIEYLVESEAELRPGDAIVFVVPGDDEPQVVVQVQCRIREPEIRERLVRTLVAKIISEFGLATDVHLVPPHSLPRTSSGKPSRAEALERFMAQANTDLPYPALEET